MPSIKSKFNFSQTLVGKEKTIPAGELLKRLKELNEELRKVNQGEADTSCDRITLELITPTLIHHRDHGVRAILACCLAEILRIYAPKAPYHSDHVQDIFSLFIKELRELTKLNDTYYLFRVQLLTSIATVRSCILIYDLDAADELMMEWFHVLLTHVTSNHPLLLHQHAIHILSTLVEYSPSLPMECIEFIFSHFNQQGSSSSSLAHDMVVQVLQRCTDVFQKSVCQYFVELILEAAKTTSTTKHFSDAFVTLKQAHVILTKIYQDVPDVLFNVIPQLEEEMVTEQSMFRLIAIQTLGTMFTQPTPFYKRFSTTWKSWLLRRNDKSMELRLAWLSFVPLIYKTHGTSIALDLTPCLEQKLIDVDDQVRTMACECLQQLPLPLLQQCITRSCLDTLGSRIKDKSVKVRYKAMETVSSIWKHFMQLVVPYHDLTQELSKNEAPLKSTKTTTTTPSHHFSVSNPWTLLSSSKLEEEELQDWLVLVGGLPSFLLSSAYLNANEMTAMLENILIDDVIHSSDLPATSWTHQCVRFVWFVSCVQEDPRALQAMYSVLQRQQITIQELHLFFQLILEKPTLTSNEDLSVWTHRLKCLIYLMVSRLPDPQNKGMDIFMKLSDLPMNAWLPWFQTLVNWSEHDFISIRKAGKHLLEFIETQVPGSRQVIGVLARRASPALMCQEHIPSLISMLSTSSSTIPMKGSFSEAAYWLVHSIATLFPSLLLPETTALLEYTEFIPEKGLSILSHLSIPTFPTPFLNQLTQWLNQPELTRLVSKVLVRSTPSMFKPILPTLVSTLESKEEEEELNTFLVPTVFLAQLAKHQRDIFQAHASKLLPIFLDWFHPDKFSFSTSSTTTFPNPSVPWLESTLWPIPCQLQCQALKLLTYHGIAHDPDTVLHLSSHVLKRTSPLLTSWPTYAGSLLKLKAVKALLRLAEHGLDARIPTSHWLLILNVIQDPIGPLREGVFHYLKTGLVKKKLSVRYFPFFCYSVLPSPPSQQQQPHQPVPNSTPLKASLLAYLKSQDLVMELPRMLFVFVHQGTWQNWMCMLHTILPVMLTVHSVGLAYQLMNLLKTHRMVSHSAQAQVHLYELAEFTLHLIRDQCKLHHWPLTNSSEPSLPSELFVPLPLEEAKANATKTYLSSSMLKKRGIPSHSSDKGNVEIIVSEPKSPLKKPKKSFSDVEMTSSSP